MDKQTSKTNIPINKELRKKLKIIKAETDSKTYCETISLLIDTFNSKKTEKFKY